MKQDFKGRVSQKLNPEFKSLAMVRNKGECEERQDELENLVKCKNGMKVICVSQEKNRFKDGSQKRRKAGNGMLALGYRKQALL